MRRTSCIRVVASVIASGVVAAPKIAEAQVGFPPARPVGAEERLAEALPPELAAAVFERIGVARADALPTRAMASLALEGVAKGRGSEEVLAGVEALAAELGVAREALQTGGRPASDPEIEAAATAIGMGVEGSTIRALANASPSGRTLAVPLLVMAGLTQRGIPADEALAAVSVRLASRVDDASLLGEFGGVGRAIGVLPGAVGPDLARDRVGSPVPGPGVTIPVGPPIERPSMDRPDPGQGRGRAPGGA